MCPFGPLRLLIESSRTQEREVPALLYSVNAVWFMMASPDHFRLSNSMLGEENRTLQIRQSGSSFIQQGFRKSHDGFMRLPDDSHVTVNTSSTVQDEQEDRHSTNVTPVLSTDNNNNSLKVEADDEDGKFPLNIYLGAILISHLFS